MPKTKKRTNRSINRPLLWAAAAVIVVAIFAAYYLSRPSLDTSRTDSSSSGSIAPDKNTSKESHSQVAQGGVEDSQGTDVTQTPASAWVSSDNGVITLKSPSDGGVLKSGDVVSGDAKIDTVQYRLIDDEVGVLAQGPISVVDGKFSGKIFFRPQAQTGSLDIFSYNANGAEINRLSIKIKLGS